MQVWNLLYAARWKHRTQKSRQKSPSGHHQTTLSGYIFASKARIDNWKKNLLSSNISCTRPHNMVNFGPLAAEIVSLVWGTPGNFNGFRVLAALLHGTLVVGVNQTLRRWTEGATYIRQGGHHVRHWPKFLVVLVFVGLVVGTNTVVFLRPNCWISLHLSFCSFSNLHCLDMMVVLHQHQLLKVGIWQVAVLAFKMSKIYANDNMCWAMLTL